jgi:hypothetical protein
MDIPQSVEGLMIAGLGRRREAGAAASGQMRLDALHKG